MFNNTMVRKIKLNDYYKIIHVSTDVLSQMIVYHGNSNYFQKFFKHEHLPKDFCLDWICFKGDVLYNQKQVNLWNSIVLKQGKEFIEYILNIIKEKVKLLKEVEESKQDLKERMYKLFEIGACTIANGLLEESSHLLAKRIFSKYNIPENKQALVLFKPFKETNMISELNDLNKLVNLLKTKYANISQVDFDNFDVSRLIEKHLEKYAFLGMNYFADKPWDKQKIIERIKENWDGFNKNKVEDFNVFMSKEDQEIIDMVREIIYWRTERNESISHACYTLRNELIKKAKESGLSYEDITHLTPEEIFNNITDLDLISQRKKGFLSYVENGEVVILTEDKINEAIEGDTSNENKTEIKGIIANPGKVVGHVKIVDVNTGLSSFEKGSILVSKYTTPSFALIIAKSRAIVTDFGGITSHASIVSREFGIPCIVGTEIATKVLKDGDLVEVDAEKGIVRKLE